MLKKVRLSLQISDCKPNRILLHTCQLSACCVGIIRKTAAFSLSLGIKFNAQRAAVHQFVVVQHKAPQFFAPQRSPAYVGL